MLPGQQPSPFSNVIVLFKIFAQWLLGRPGVYGLPAAIPWLGLGETRYRDPQTPSRMTRAAASLLERTRLAALQEALGSAVSTQRQFSIV